MWFRDTKQILVNNKCVVEDMNVIETILINDSSQVYIVKRQANDLNTQQNENDRETLHFFFKQYVLFKYSLNRRKKSL